MSKLPWQGILKKGLALFVWGISSTLVLCTGFYLLGNLQNYSLTLPFFGPSSIYSLYSALPDSGQVLGQKILSKDARVAILEDYLQFQRSPLAPLAEKFIEAAEHYELPWTLLPAIAGKESGFGKVIPHGSYNPFGWAVYQGQKQGTNFSSWEEAIEKVAKSLREDYFNQGLTTLGEIEAVYAPSSPERGHPWKETVEYFIWEIENWR